MLPDPGENDLDVTPVSPADQGAPDAGQKPETPEPSPGTEAEGDEPKTLADAIGQAIEDGEQDKPAEKPVEPQKPVDPDNAPKPTEPQSEPGKEPEPADDDPTDAELKAMRPQPRDRVVKLLSQRNTARRERDELRTAAQTFEADAGAYREITGFMAQHRLQANEVQELFDIGRKLKSNDPRQYAEVLEVLMPVTRGLLELTGRAIPADIRARVEQGDVTEETARQMAQERAARVLAEQQANRLTTEQQQQQRVQANTTYQQGIQSAVGAWEQGVRKTDPDFDRKRTALEDAAYGILARRGAPQTPDQAVAFAKEAYERVNAAYRSNRPALTPTRPTPSAAGVSGNRAAARPAPSSLREAILGAMDHGA